MQTRFSSAMLIDYLDQNIFVKDLRSQYLFCNGAYAQLLGIEPDDIIGRTDFDFFPNEIAEQYQKEDRRIIEGEKRIEICEEIVIDGEQRVIKTVKKPLVSRGELIAVIGTFWDITGKFKKEQKLHELQEGLKKAQELASIGHWELDLARNRLYWSDEVYRIFGLEPQEFGATYEAFLSFVHPDDVEAVNDAYRVSVAEKKEEYHITHRVLRRDGTLCYVEEHCSHDYDSEGNVVRSIGTVHDITERKEAEQELLLAAKIVKQTTNGVLITDENQKIIQVNDAFTRITGYTFEEVEGKNPSILSSGWNDKAYYEKMWKTIEEAGMWCDEIWDRKKDGKLYVADLSISAVKDERGKVTNYVAITSDITEKREKEKQIESMAYYDALTHLPNRLLFQERIEQRIRRANRTKERFGLLFFDLDNFKYVNDSMGHFTGDKFLQAVGERIGKLLRQEDTLARIGGDEFTIIIETVDKMTQFAMISQKILDAFIHPFNVEGKEIYSGCSIGISVYPDDGKDYTSLFKAADTAMYHVKESGKNGYQFFAPRMNKKAMERMLIENDLRRAIERDELFVVYQPKVNTLHNKVYGMEALIRWEHPRQGLIRPDTFISVAEEAGQIYKIGLWIAERACRDAKKLHECGCNDLVVSINVSNVQLKKSEFVDDILEVINKTGIRHELVELEITESGLMHNIDDVLQKLKRLHDANIKLAIDDFGTGYSSLSYLKKFPVQTLKIDRSFILDIDTDPDDRSIICAIVAMAKSLNMEVIAEGSETQAHVDALKELECYHVQGYFFAKPMRIDAFRSFINNAVHCL